MFTSQKVKDLENQISGLKFHSEESSRRYWELLGDFILLLEYLNLSIVDITKRRVVRPIGENVWITKKKQKS